MPTSTVTPNTVDAMSNLKHMTPLQLRLEIDSLTRARNKLQIQWELNEDAAKILLDEADQLRQKYHNLGQRECWARIYLAEKT